MIGEYVNTGRGMNVPISPAVPGAQYRITAWAFGNGRRSVTPAVKSVITGEASELIYKEEYILDLYYSKLVQNTSFLLLHSNTFLQSNSPLQSKESYNHKGVSRWC